MLPLLLLSLQPAPETYSMVWCGTQDMASWSRDGIAGLQSVVLYSLPELDGAIDTVPLGGLVGDNIFLVSERVTRLSQRIKKWVHLRRSQPQVSPSQLPLCCACVASSATSVPVVQPPFGK